MDSKILLAIRNYNLSINLCKIHYNSIFRQLIQENLKLQLTKFKFKKIDWHYQ